MDRELISAWWCGKVRLLPGMMLLMIAIYLATNSHRVQFISCADSDDRGQRIRIVVPKFLQT